MKDNPLRRYAGSVILLGWLRSDLPLTAKKAIVRTPEKALELQSQGWFVYMTPQGFEDDHQDFVNAFNWDYVE